MIRFRFVDEHRNAHVVKRMCDVLGWDRSGYYTWHKNAEAREEKAGIEEELVAPHPRDPYRFHGRLRCSADHP